jgi:hypothetical protein
MATMSFKDMLEKAGLTPDGAANYYWDKNLAKLIGEHGVDYNGLLDSIKKAHGQAPTSDSVIKRTVNSFVERYSNEIKDGAIDASPQQIEELLNGYETINTMDLPLFKNLTPQHVVSVRDWPNNYNFSDIGKARFVELFKKPEFRKALIAASGNRGRNWQIPISLMPDLSREDAEYIAANVPSQLFHDATVDENMPIEFNKTSLKMRAKEGRPYGLFRGRAPLFRAAEQMMVSPDESPEVRDHVARSVIYKANDISLDDSNLPYILKTIAQLPAEDLKRHLDAIPMSEPSDFAKRFNKGTFSPEQNAVVDDWSKKSDKTTIARFIGSGRANELPQDQLENILEGWMRSHDLTHGMSRHEQLASRDSLLTALGSLPKDTIDRMMDERKESVDSRARFSNTFLGMWKYLNPRGESPSDEQFQSELESTFGFLEDKFNLDHKMRLEGAKTSIISTDDLRRFVPETMYALDRAMKVLVHPNATRDIVNRIREFSLNGNYGEDLDYPLDGMGNFKSLTSRSPFVLDGTHGGKTDVKVGSTALRHLRDHLDERAAEGVASLRPEDLPKGKTFNTLTRSVTDKKGNVQHVLDWNPLRDNRAGGNLTSEKVREAIDAMPIRSVVLRTTEPWTGGQNHAADGTQVMQVMPSAETMQKIKDAGLWTAFGEMSRHHMEEGTIHPTAPFHLGWIRYSTHPDNEEVFIDEIQSDLHTSFRQLMKKPDNKLKEQMQSVMDILFGKSHPSEVLHEAFHQNLRDNGAFGYKVHIHSVKSKAHMSLQDPDKPVPAHFKEGYEAIPKKMGYTPAKYGDLSIETGDGDRKARQLDGMPTHGSKVVKFEEMLFELSKGEW